MVPDVYCTLFFGYFISVLLVHIGTRFQLLFYIGGMIVYGVTSCIICEDGVSIPLVVVEVESCSRVPP